MIEIKKISENVWEIPKTGKMNVPGRVFANDNLIEQIREEDVTLNQIINVAKMPGAVGNSLAMADCHMGYGMCIGGVAAFDIKKGGISSPQKCDDDIYIVRVIERKKAGTLKDLSDVKEEINNILVQKWHQRNLREKIDDLKKEIYFSSNLDLIP